MEAVSGSNIAYIAAEANSTAANSWIYVNLADAAGASQFRIHDSAAAQVFGVNSDGDIIRPIANDSTALGAYYGRVPIYINGSLKYLAVYS
jgi:hypothetical protein